MDKTNSFAGVKTELAPQFLETSLIVIAEDLALLLNDSDKSFYVGNVQVTSIPEDYLTTPWKYNLIVIVHDSVENEGSYLGYTANHFCYMLADNILMGNCYDSIEDLITHFTSITIANNTIGLEYRGYFISGNEQNPGLSAAGARASIYLQKIL